jgi:hypothetical protein
MEGMHNETCLMNFDAKRSVADMHRIVVKIVVICLFCLNATESVYSDQNGIENKDVKVVERFFDDYLKTKMAENHVAGVVVAVVKDTQIMLKKGYGYADVNQKKISRSGKECFHSWITQ